MMVGPVEAVSGPNEPPPVKPGHRGQLARLIRERLVFVNLPGHAGRSEGREPQAACPIRPLGSKSGTRIISLLVPMSFRLPRESGCQDGFGKGFLGPFALADSGSALKQRAFAVLLQR
jgi:hypothetical protein